MNHVQHVPFIIIIYTSNHVTRRTNDMTTVTKSNDRIHQRFPSNFPLHNFPRTPYIICLTERSHDQKDEATSIFLILVPS